MRPLRVWGIGGEEVEELKLEALHDKAVGEKIRNPQMRPLRSGQ